MQLSWHPPLYFNVWPADFNEDGIADLVAATTAATGSTIPRPADLVVLIGRGNGTFLPASPLGIVAIPLTASDINADGFVDIVIWRGTIGTVSDGTVEILAGNGDGTFDPARVVTPNVQFTDPRFWGYAADFDGDRHRDLIVQEYQTPEPGMRLFPGNGDFTFDAPIDLPSASGPIRDIAAGDFNGDGRLDLAAIPVCCEIDLFLNQGGRTFVRSGIFAVPSSYTDITAGDLNRDGKLDLIVSSSPYDFYESDDTGQVYVLIGNGNGTFQARVPYDTGVRGETTVAVGDFNGDAKLDVATGNRSVVVEEEFQLWDSISIMPGDGTGRLLRATNYALSYVNPTFQTPDPNYPYLTAIHTLNTTDLNGDRRTDLIASPGVTLLNRAPAPNRAPSVFAGPDRMEFANDGQLFLQGEASDPDNHWLTYTWTNESGQVIGRLPLVRPSQASGTTRTYTLTVDDGHGGIARDSVTIRLRRDDDPAVFVTQPTEGAAVRAGQPYVVQWEVVNGESLQGFALSYSIDDGRTFTAVAGCGALPASARQCTWTNPGPPTERARMRVVASSTSGPWIAVSGRFRIVTGPVLPAGWNAIDIGAVGAAGTTAFSNGTWTVEGSGADIWGTADEFRYVYLRGGASFSFTARVANIENLHRWVKAGVMVREDLTPGSRHASLFATPTTERGLAFQRRPHLNGLSEHTAGPALAPPVWLRIGRYGDVVSAYYRTSTAQTWTLVGRQTISALQNQVYVGLAVSSHIDGSLATAVFDNVSLTPDLITQSYDIGNVGVPGTATFDGVVHELEGSGADIWGTADAFRFAVSQAHGPGSVQEISVRVRSIENTHHWAKAGVMFRQASTTGREPGARHVMVVVSPGRGVAMQYRPTTNGLSVQAGVVAGMAPEWVRLARSGNTFTGSASEDGVTWRTIGSVTIADLAPYPGLVVTSHNNSTLATATFEDLVFRMFP